MKRESGLLLLGLIFLLLFAGLYYVHATGIWAAKKNPPQFINGRLEKIWQPVAEDPTRISMLKVRIEDDVIIHLTGSGKLIFDCTVGDRVEVLIYSRNDHKKYHRLGPKACFKPR